MGQLWSNYQNRYDTRHLLPFELKRIIFQYIIGTSCGNLISASQYETTELEDLNWMTRFISETEVSSCFTGKYFCTEYHRKVR